jgi:hypothetical protein
MVLSIPSLALPVGDSSNARSMPVVTWAMIALHLLVFFFAVLPTMSEEARVDRDLAVEWRRDVIKAPASEELASEELASEELAEREAMTAEERQLAEMVEDLVKRRARPEADTLFVDKSGYRPGSPSFHKLLSSLACAARPGPAWRSRSCGLGFLWERAKNSNDAVTLAGNRG